MAGAFCPYTGKKLSNCLIVTLKLKLFINVAPPDFDLIVKTILVLTVVPPGSKKWGGQNDATT